MSECEFKMESAIKVFKNYFNADPNLESANNFKPSDLDVKPITINDTEITYFLGAEFEEYNTNSVISRQLHKNFIEDLLQRIDRRRIAARLTLKGPSGVGKTTSLLIIGQIAKEMNILVFPIKARSFTEGKDLDISAYLFIVRWSNDNKEILAHLNSKQTLYLFNFDNLKKENATKTLCEVIENLKMQSVTPVLFIVDDCNAFHHTHQIIQNGELKKITEPLENPIGRYFSCDIKNFDISSGGVLFAYSSIFEFTSKNFTYNIAEVSPFSSDEWIRLFNTDEESKEKNSQVKYAGFNITNELGPLLGHLPRELREFQKTFSQLQPTLAANKEILKSTYLSDASDRFKVQLAKLFERSNDEDTAVIGFKMFFEIDVINPGTIWKSSGLCARNTSDLSYRFSCPAVRSAYRDFLKRHNREFAKFNIFANAISHTPAKGYLLEMFFEFKCNMVLATIKDETPAILTFRAKSFVIGEDDKTFNIKFRKIVREVDLESSDDSDWQKGTVLIFKQDTRVVDFAIIDDVENEGNLVLYLFQASYIKFSQHKAKPDDLFEKREGENMTLFERICAKLKRKTDNKDTFSKYDFYIYLQPTDANKRKVISSHSISERESNASIFSSCSSSHLNPSKKPKRSSSRLSAKSRTSTPTQTSSQDTDSVSSEIKKRRSINQTQCYLINGNYAKDFLGEFEQQLFHYCRK